MLKAGAMSAFGLARRNPAMDGESVRVHWLHRASGFVPEVHGALIAPLGLTLDAAREAKRLALGAHWAQTAQAEVGHMLVAESSI